MPKEKVVLVTGVSGYWGAQVAAQLIEAQTDRKNTKYHVIGLDVEPPKQEIKGLDFIQADIRNPLLHDLLKVEGVQAVCHLVFNESIPLSETSFNVNVIGTMKVLGACAEAGVRKVVLKSSTCVYGAHPTNSAFLTEQQPLQGSRNYGSTRDLMEIEAFCNGFRRRTPEMVLTILRFPGIIGPSADTPMIRFLKEPWTPMLLGFDPLMQVIHERDVVRALTHVMLNDVSGVFNVAAEGVLPITRLMALAGKIPLPLFHLVAYWGAGMLGGNGLRLIRFAPIELDYIRYPWVGDLTCMKTELRFAPRYTAEEALREFAGMQRLRRYVSESAALAYDEERLRDTMERRQRSKMRTAKTPGDVAGKNGNE